MNNLNLNEFEVSFPKDVDHHFENAYGEKHWKEMKAKLSLPPSYTTIRVNTLKTTSKQLIERLTDSLVQFNAQLQRQKRQPVKVVSHDCLDDVVLIPSAKASMESQQLSSEYKDVIVDRLCGEAVLRGSDIFAVGVISASAGLESNERVNIWVELEHKTNRGTKASHHQGKKVYVGQGMSLMGRSELFAAKEGVAVSVVARVCSDSPPLNGVLSRDMYIQNLPSIIVAHVLKPQPGDVVLDMCAGPGGKTSHLASFMQNKGTLVACDKSKRKAIRMKKFFEELDLECIVPLKMDSMHSALSAKTKQFVSVGDVISNARKLRTDSSKLLQIDGFPPESFDKILLDPPCSALGLRPRLIHCSDLEGISKHANMQRNFIREAVRLLKRGGILVYSTCTINPDENERIVRFALDNFSIELVSQSPHLGDIGLINQGLTVEQAQLVQRFDPASDIDTMGFFCAKFVKKC